MNYSKPYRSLCGLLLAAVLLLSGGLAVAQEFRGTIYFPRSVQMALKLYF